MKNRKKKQQKSKNLKEDLPSFLLNLKGLPENIGISQRKKEPTLYLGPIFFGECLQFHPPHHSVPLSSFHHIQYSAAPKDNFLRDFLLPKSLSEKKYHKSKAFHPLIKREKKFSDHYLHRCPGVRRGFACDHLVPEGLGQSKSVIQGETSREIPFCRLKKVPSDCYRITSDPQLEIVTLSDIREENRMFMSYKERMAHSHFPKEFVSVEIIGPIIPEPITVIKLPSKRPAMFEIDLHLKSKTNKTIKRKGESLTEKGSSKEKETSEKSTHSFLSEEDSNVKKDSDGGSEKEQGDEMGEGYESEQSQILLDEENGVEEEEEEEEEVESGEEEEEITDLEDDEEREREKSKFVSFAEERKNSSEAAEENNISDIMEN